jgi:hypothetical protein
MVFGKLTAKDGGKNTDWIPSFEGMTDLFVTLAGTGVHASYKTGFPLSRE